MNRKRSESCESFNREGGRYSLYNLGRISCRKEYPGPWGILSNWYQRSKIVPEIKIESTER